ncbi:hypothetical protein PFMALIP_05819, partial [Plasmodium falciparum MaliPS096_E11]
MAPQGVSGGGGGKDDYKNAKDAKELLDRIGEDVYKKVQAKAQVASKKYFDELHGSLKDARFEKAPETQQTQGNPCELDHRYHTNATNVRSYPCRAGKEERFSQVHGGECDEKKIKGSNGGACAPYRRLHLCVRNLENIKINKYINKDTLLADVCLAAKYEGDLINTHYTLYQQKYGITDSTICTMLARSFADIGDIIRGKDLYRGVNGNDKLENKLKEIFKKIHEGLSTKKGAQNYYKDENGGNYFKLREDWWNANRQQVWYAITCGAGSGKYFRRTCVSGNWTKDKCRCPSHKVPTYFDYVPQYLRWFEEWAEDFCRKRKKQLENAKKYCREEDENGENRYCDLNGYDCKNTAKGKNKYKHDQECIKCSSVCIPFGPWIKNQKQEFEKQKNKYENEILGKSRRKRSIGSDTYEGYIEQFYDILKREYRDVGKFLDILSKETACQKQPYDERGTIDISFKNPEGIDIFSSTKYCQACPWCGIEEQKVNGRWIAKGDEDCNNKEIIKFNNEDTTDISILSTDRGKTKILEKLGSFCRNGEKIKKDDWKCHYDDNDKSDNCILQNDKKDKEDQTVESFNSLFWHWITEMFEDSIKWRKEHENCINNNNTCKKGCKNPCECFKNWVKRMKVEWDQIKQHYEKEDFGVFGPYWTLEGNLQNSYLEMIQEAHPNEKLVQKMKEIIENNNIMEATRNNNSITKFLQHEEGIAETCKKIQKDCEKKAKAPENPAGGGGAKSGEPPDGRSATSPNDQPAVPSPDTTASPDDDAGHDDDENDDPNKIPIINFPDEKDKVPVFKAENEVEEEASEEGTKQVETEAEAKTEVTETPKQDGQGPPVDNVKPACQIVEELFNNPDNFKEVACQQKYAKNNSRLGWKCIPTSGGSGNTAGSGSICVPPRRRRLYVKDLETFTGETQIQLRDAFIKCAAVETFFLWHKYKEDKEKKKKKPENGAAARLSQLQEEDDNDEEEENPQQELEGGTIPEEFKRQMFYTLGDYRDILFGDTTMINTVSRASGDKDTMKKIQEKIQQILSQNGEKPSKPSGTTPQQTWWGDFAQYIWNGMVCALTYKEDTDSGAIGQPPKQNDTLKNALLDGEGKKTPKDEYQYDKAKLEEKNSGEKTPTLLSQFVLRPPYFRYLEEWGETFCRERAKRLEEVRKECRGVNYSGNEKYCSGDGYHCNNKLNHNNMFHGIDCPDCAKECIKYRKWIDIKFVEFHNQRDKYKGEHEKLTNNNCSGGGDNNCCKDIEKHSTAARFLAALKHCKDGQGVEDKNNDNKIDFDNPLQTFSRSTYCKTCPLNGVTCNGGRGKNGCKEVNGNEWETVFNEMSGNSTITVDMMDRRWPFIEEYIKNSQKSNDSLFKESRLFKGIRKQQWECRFNKDENKDVCKLNKFKENIDLNEYTTFKVFLEYWIQDFLYGYYILKKRKIIEKCTQKGEKACSGDGNYKNDCACVGKWVQQKTTEWEQIKNHFNIRKDDEAYTIEYKVKTFLGDLIPRMDLTNGKEKIQELNKFLRSYECNCAENSKSDEHGTPKDIVECLLKKLEDKANECKDQASGKNPVACENSPSVEDGDEPLEEENPVKAPKICGDMKTQPTETESEETCDAPPVVPEQPAKEDGDPAAQPEDDTEKKAPVKPAPTPRKPPRPQPQPPQPDLSPLKNAMLSSTIMWSIGIGFAAFTYFYLK